MKFAVASEHRKFFHQNGYIEFAGLLSDTQIERVNQDVKHALIHRHKLTGHASLSLLLPNDLYIQGRDLWREASSIKRALTNPSMAEIAWELCQKRPLRIGYDQLLPKAVHQFDRPIKNNQYEKLRSSTKTIASLSALQGVCCGIIICLEGLDDREEKPGVFPLHAGNGVYVSPDCPIDFSEANPNCEYLLLIYTVKDAVFIMNENDELNHFFKDLGYTYGDALKDKLNPIVLR